MEHEKTKIFSLSKVKEVKGLPWGAAAIGNAKWSGARLVDVLEYCKLNFSDDRIQHVQFEGLDLDTSAVPYGASIPSDYVNALHLNRIKKHFLLGFGSKE